MTTISSVLYMASACRRPSDAGGHEDQASAAHPELPTRATRRQVAVPVGARPLDLAAGDLDGDERIDLVSANGGDQTLSSLLQRDGGWVSAQGSPTAIPTDTHLIALADLDRDRDLDLLSTGHDSGGVTVLLGDGHGRFAAAPGSPFPAFNASHPHNHGLTVGDIDGDGDPDAVVADQDAGQAAVLLADGKGGLGLAPGSPFTLGGHPYPPTLADLDDDQRLDLIVPLVDDHSIAIMLGAGNGTFAHAPGSPWRTALARPYAIVVADLDRDGHDDVVAIHDDTDKISAWLGAGDGQLREAPGSPVSLGRRVWRMSAADIDRDGAVDLVGAGSGSLVVVPGDGRGGLGPAQLEPLGEGWHALAVDLDGDGWVDLAAPDSNAGVLRLWLSGTGRISAPQPSR